MDRKEFLKACSGGLCLCAAAALPGAAKAAEAPKEDWRLGFIKQRWAKLLGTLSQKMDGPALDAALQDMGKFCAAQNDEQTKKFAGDLDGFCKELAKSPKNRIVRDDTRKVYVSSYTPDEGCVCPFNSAKTPGVMCNCSIGWTRHTWGIVLGKEPRVVMKETVLRGGKSCVAEITAA